MPKVTDPRLLQQLGQSGQMVAPNPMFPGQLQGQGLNNTGQGLQNAERTATLPYAGPKAAAEASNAATQANVNAATAPADIANKGALARTNAVQAQSAERGFEVNAGANEGQAKSASFYNRAMKANQLYEGTGINDEPMGHSIAQSLLPSGLVNEFTSKPRQQAEAAQRDFIASTLRYESGAAIAQSEFDNQKKVFFPQPGDGPETVALKTKLRKNAIDGLRMSAGPAAELVDQPALTAANTSIGDVGGAILGEPAFKDAFDPQTSAAMDRLMRMGRPVQEISAFAQSRGYPVTPEVLSSIAQVQLFLKRNPKYKGPLTRAVKPTPMSLRETISGSPLGAFGSAAGSAATLGLNDEAAGVINALDGGDYTQGRDAYNAKKHLLADAHPYADFAGTAVGASGALGAIGKAGGALKLGKFLAPTARYGQTAADVANIGASRAGTLGDIAYGSGYGAGENNENRILGAGEGGGAAYGGNLAGRAMANTLGALVSPTGGRLKDLYAMGVRPSIGQRVGGFVDSAEERLQSIPLLGDVIAGTRNRARDQYQIGLFNDSLGEIGAQIPKGMRPGHDPHRFAQDAFAKAYDSAERGMTAIADAPMGADLGNLQKTVMGLSEGSQKQFGTIWDASVGRRFKLGGGTLSGDAYKDAMSELSKKSAALRKNPQGDHELADAFDEAMSALRGSATRNSPHEAVAALDAADRGYAKLVRLETASRKAGGDAATFSPVQYNSAVKEASGGIRNRGYLAGDALNSDIASQGLHLGDVVANSRTVDRLLPMMAATGGAYVSPPAGAALGLYGLLNAPGLRNFTTGIMAPRRGQARTLADFIREQARTAGTIGSGVGVGLLPSR